MSVQMPKGVKGSGQRRSYFKSAHAEYGSTISKVGGMLLGENRSPSFIPHSKPDPIRVLLQDCTSTMEVYKFVELHAYVIENEPIWRIWVEKCSYEDYLAQRLIDQRFPEGYPRFWTWIEQDNLRLLRLTKQCFHKEGLGWSSTAEQRCRGWLDWINQVSHRDSRW